MRYPVSIRRRPIRPNGSALHFPFPIHKFCGRAILFFASHGFSFADRNGLRGFVGKLSVEIGAVAVALVPDQPAIESGIGIGRTIAAEFIRESVRCDAGDRSEI